ncbi:TPA: hypothetical protein ACUUEN_005502 [Pseudomonas aeruginosa]
MYPDRVFYPFFLDVEGPFVGRTVPVRFNTEDLARVEEAAALAGYKKLSPYIRDRLLSPEGGSRSTDVNVWADQQRMLAVLESIAQEQARHRALLAVAIFMIRQSATQGRLNELRAQLQRLVGGDDALMALLPELADDIERLTGDD